MEKILSVFTFLVTAATVLSGSYATLCLILAGMALMSDNDMKRESGKDRMKYIIGGYLICLAAGAITAWLKTA